MSLSVATSFACVGVEVTQKSTWRVCDLVGSFEALAKHSDTVSANPCKKVLKRPTSEIRRSTIYWVEPPHDTLCVSPVFLHSVLCALHERMLEEAQNVPIIDDDSDL